MESDLSVSLDLRSWASLIADHYDVLRVEEVRQSRTNLFMPFAECVLGEIRVFLKLMNCRSDLC